MMALWLDVEDDPSTFLKSFPTYDLHSEPGPQLNRLWVFSSMYERYENNSYSSDDADTRTMICNKIKSIFSKMDYRLGTIVQFWAPVTNNGKRQLSTSGQPFATSNVAKDFIKYRRRVEEYGYDIDANSNNSKFRGTPVSAFLNHFTEIASTNTSVHHEVDPLLRNDFQECDLTTSFMIPISCPSQNSSSSDCIGVIECSSSLMDHVHLTNDTNTKIKEVLLLIKEVDLSVYNVQDLIPYKTIKELELARDQIQAGLKFVCQLHHITLAQVWITSVSENYMHLSSCEEAQTRRPLGLKLTGYYSIEDNSARDYLVFQNYYDACDLIPLQPGHELVMKTLQDYKPRFCKNISQLFTYKLNGWDWYADGDRSMGLAICMTNIHTPDFNYVFEFLWKHNPLKPILLEKILSEIKKCLPSFKFASGTEICDKLLVIEVDNSTDKEIKKFDTSQLAPLDTNCKTAPVFEPQQVIELQSGTSVPNTTENNLENISGNGNLIADSDDERLSDAMNKGKKSMVVNYNARSMEKRNTSEKKISREMIEQHHGMTERQAAKELGVCLSTLKRKRKKYGMLGWIGPDSSKRKEYSSKKNRSKESHTHEKDNGVIQDPSPVKRDENTVIKAEYAGDKIRLHLPISEATFVTVENEIGKRFNLEHRTFKIDYLDEDDEWLLMKTDQDWNYCIQSSRKVYRSAVHLRVRLRNQ